MSPIEAMVLIVGIIAIVIMRGMKSRRDQHGEMPVIDHQAGIREADLNREVTDLRARIAVLERIATDANTSDERHKRAIAEEIESLRDR